jgi:DNA-binding MarR family transcriptional regulator
MSDSKRKEQHATATWLAVAEAYSLCQRRYGETLRQIGLSPAQYDVLNALALSQQAITLSELADRLLVSRPNVTTLVQRLKHQGWVMTTVCSDDRRAIRCALSTTGSDIHRQAQQLTKNFINTQMSPFNMQQLATMTKLMKEMKDHLQDMALTEVPT